MKGDSPEINYTSEMEKAMLQSHDMGYAEYERGIDQKVKVEKKREQSYEKSQRIVNEIERKAHR